MERKKPLQRKTPLKAKTSIQPTGWKLPRDRKRKGINVKSAKRKIADERRRRLLAKMRSRIDICQIRCVRDCTGAPTDGHEIWTRGRGGPIDEEWNILLTCRPCHTYVTGHPKFSDDNGFTVHEWESDAKGMAAAKEKRDRFHTLRE